MAHPPGHLATHPLPPGIVGALGLSGYTLLTDVGGVGAGRLGPQAFLMIAPDDDPAVVDPNPQIVLHHTRVRSDAEAAAFRGLAAELGLRRLSGWRLALEREGLRSKVSLVDPATGSIRLTIPARHPGGMLSLRGGAGVDRLRAAVQALPAAGRAPDLQDPELTRSMLLALALRDDRLDGAQAVDVADRALALMQSDRALAPPAAIQTALGETGSASSAQTL